MATLIFTAIGTLIGGPLGGSIGALMGREVDTMVLGRGAREGPRLTELSVTTSSYGYGLPRQFGRMRVGGQIIWATDLTEHRDKQGGGKGKPSTVSYSYTASFAVALASRPIREIGRIWADGKLLRGASGDLKTGGTFRFHPGRGDQAPDPLLAAAEAQGRCPAYRGLAYAVFEDLQLGDFGNRIPALTFEVIADPGTLTLDTLLDGAIEDFDAAIPLTGLEGIAIDGPLIDALTSLDTVYPIACDASDRALTINPDRHQAGPITLPEATAARQGEHSGGAVSVARTRNAANETPVAILRYYDPERDFQPGAQRASGRPLPGQPRAVELPAALSAGAARHLVEAAAKRGQWSRQTFTWRVTQIDPAIRPGATVIVPGQAGQWRVRAWEWRDDGVELTLERLSPELAATLSADPGRVAKWPDLKVAETHLAVCELPWDGNAGTSVPLLLAAASSPGGGWAGASLYVDQGDGNLVMLGTTGRNRAIIGAAVSSLQPASPLLFDRHGSVIVQLAAPDLMLADATMRQLALGANRALLGNEIIQFAKALPLGNGRWQLTGLWHGRGGTEAAITGHQEGETFMLLDGTGTVLDPEQIGSIPDTRIVALGLGDAGPVSAPIALRGIGWRPPSPVHGKCVLMPDGSAVLSWTRRARGAWHWADSVETPLNEQVELYEVTAGPANAPIARWETTQPRLTIAASQLAELQAGLASGSFTVRQCGDRGVSEPLSIDLN